VLAKPSKSLKGIEFHLIIAGPCPGFLSSVTAWELGNFQYAAEKTMFKNFRRIWVSLQTTGAVYFYGVLGEDEICLRQFS
jgi:hypothetical protein